MNRFNNIPTQIDIIDYMLSQSGEVPMLDRSLSNNDMSDQQLHAEGIDAHHDEEQNDEFDEEKLVTDRRYSRRLVM
ncbi:MAG: hypothetical protein MRY32_06260 [Rickettsiales bacterium]|nr:hypothetical protein [Rickettsiales bacterium]